VRTWAILPVKPLSLAKSRLAPILPPDQRSKLAIKMLLHTINLLQSTRSIGGILVISRDPKALSIVRDQGDHIFTIQESGQPELNTALTRATDLLASWGAEATLVLPTDIPLLKREDIEQILHLGRYQTSVVLAPDQQRDGTNALLMHPPGVIEYCFGPGSFEKHIAVSELAGVNLNIYQSERISLDVDTPEDLEKYFELAHKYEVPQLEYQQVGV